MGKFEIDVTTQLFPNVLTMIATFLATLIIFLIAKKYLFKHAREFMAKRQDKMQEGLLMAENKEKEASKYLEDAKEDLAKARFVANDLETKAKSEALLIREQMIEEAKNEAELIVKRANKQIANKQKEAEKEVKRHIVDVALLASQKLLESNTEQLDEVALDKILKELKHE